MCAAAKKLRFGLQSFDSGERRVRFLCDAIHIVFPRLSEMHECLGKESSFCVLLHTPDSQQNYEEHPLSPHVLLSQQLQPHKIK